MHIAFANTIKFNSNIKKLYVAIGSSPTGETSPSIIYLLECIKLSTSITSLGMFYCRFTIDEFKKFLSMILENDSIKELNMTTRDYLLSITIDQENKNDILEKLRFCPDNHHGKFCIYCYHTRNLLSAKCYKARRRGDIIMNKYKSAKSINCVDY